MSDGLIELAFDGARRRRAGEVRHLDGEATSVQAAAQRTVASYHPAENVTGPGDLFGLEERCKQDWAGSPALRDEFRSLEVYTAYRKAEARGLVRIFGGRRREA